MLTMHHTDGVESDQAIASKRMMIDVFEHNKPSIPMLVMVIFGSTIEGRLPISATTEQMAAMETEKENNALMLEMSRSVVESMAPHVEGDGEGATQYEKENVFALNPAVAVDRIHG